MGPREMEEALVVLWHRFEKSGKQLGFAYSDEEKSFFVSGARTALMEVERLAGRASALGAL